MFAEYLSKLLDWRKFHIGRSRKNPITRQSQFYPSPWEAKIFQLQSVLIWEKPNKSILAILIANFIYWYIVYSEVQLYFGFSMLGLISFLHNQWVYYIWPEISVPDINLDQEEWTPIHPCVLSAPELSRYLRNCLSYVQEQVIRLALLRRKQPAFFCAVMVAIFCFLWMLGHFISGVILLYSLLMGVMCIPGFVINCVPHSVIEQIRQVFLVIQNFKQNDADDDNGIKEFLPEESLPEISADFNDETTHLTPRVTDSFLDDSTLRSSTRLRSKQANKKKRRKAKNIRPDTNETENSFTLGLSDGDFPSMTLGHSDEVDISLSGIPSCEVTHIVSDLCEEEINFLPSHFGEVKKEESFNQSTSVDSSSIRDIDSNDELFTVNSGAPSSVMNQLINMATVENTTAFLSNFGQQVASALTRQASGNSDHSAHSNLDEDFEMISDEELQ